MAQPQSYSRKRRVPRRSFSRPIGLLVDGHYFITHSMELGEGGMGFISQVPMVVGKRVLISFKLPTGSPTVVRAVVRYVAPKKGEQIPRYGVEFLNLEFAMRREIRNFVASKDAPDVPSTWD